jgi:hypothetical protein
MICCSVALVAAKAAPNAGGQGCLVADEAAEQQHHRELFWLGQAGFSQRPEAGLQPGGAGWA